MNYEDVVASLKGVDIFIDCAFSMPNSDIWIKTLLILCIAAHSVTLQVHYENNENSSKVEVVTSVNNDETKIETKLNSSHVPSEEENQPTNKDDPDKVIPVTSQETKSTEQKSKEETVVETTEQPFIENQLEVKESPKLTQSDEADSSAKEVDSSSAKNIDSDESKNISETEPTKPSDLQSNQSTSTKDEVSSESKKPTEEKTVELEVDDIQSFEEWKKKQIESREDGTAKETIISPLRTIRTKKTQMNYASQNCGAKILGHNKEGQHVSAILDENKDMYMLNPCSVPVWFVVELCEPIQVQQVQLANLELFSSMPHLFELFISERYPAREWRSLDTFEARNERSIQTFEPKREEVMFAKYLKFEMKSHFGNEHFCPLTLIRVLGVSMAEEYEEDDDAKVIKGKVEEEKEKADAKKIPDEAAVEVENHSSGEKETGSIGKMFNIVKSAVGNLLGNGKEEMPTSSANDTNASETNQSDTQEEVIDPAWESPVTLVTNRSEVEGRPKTEKNSVIVTLLETGNGQEIFIFDNEPPLYSLKFMESFSPENFGTKLCWFLEFMYRVSILSCIVQPHRNQTSTMGSFSYERPKTVRDHTQSPVSKENKASAPTDEIKYEPNFVLVEKKIEEKPDPPNISDTITVPKDDEVVKKIEVPNSTSSKETNDEQQQDDATTPKTLPSVNLNDVETSSVAEKTDSSEPVSSDANDSNNIKQILTDGKQTCDKPDAKDEDSEKTETINSVETPASHIDSEFDKTTSSKTNSGNDNKNQPQSKEVVPEINNPKSPTTQQQTAQQSVVPTSTENKVLDSHSKDSVEVTKTEPKKSNSEASAPQNVTTALPPDEEQDTSKAIQKESLEDTVVINAGINQKESVLMRLSNRIRALEQNLSLSSAYLEDLSKRYKRQMDEMQRAFNRTQTRLSESARTAEENNCKLKEAIAQEKEKNDVLTKTLGETTESIEQLNKYMIARHLCLMALESIIFIIICVTCFGVRQIRLVRRIEQSEKLIIQLMSPHQNKFANGHAKMVKQGKLHAGKLPPIYEDYPLKSSVNKASKKCDYSLDITSSGKHDSGCGNSSSSSTSSSSPPQRKSIKGPPSPLFKRKLNPNGKVRKTSKSNNTNILPSTSSYGTWASDFGKNSKISKSKKGGHNKEKKGDNMSSIGSSCRLQPYRSEDMLGCGTKSVSWHTNMFSGSLYGKAR